MGIYFIETSAITGEEVEQSFFTLAALIDSNQEFLLKSSFSLNTMNSFVEETTKEGTKEGSVRSSVMAVYKHQRTESFFLKRSQKQKNNENCCR
jgi:hypothetical protein